MYYYRTVPLQGRYCRQLAAASMSLELADHNVVQCNIMTTNAFLEALHNVAPDYKPAGKMKRFKRDRASSYATLPALLLYAARNKDDTRKTRQYNQ